MESDNPEEVQQEQGVVAGAAAVDNSLTLGELCDEICEFVEVAVHSILYYRAVYPRETFENKNMYNIAVPMSRSSLLCEYVTSSISELKPAIQKGCSS
jgi:hypothetical protein